MLTTVMMKSFVFAAWTMILNCFFLLGENLFFLLIYSMQSSLDFIHAWQTFHKNGAATNRVALIKRHGAPSFQVRFSDRWQSFDFTSLPMRKIFSQNIFNRKGQIHFVFAKLHSSSCNSDLMGCNGRPVGCSVESEIVFSLNTQFLWSRDSEPPTCHGTPDTTFKG